MSVEPWVGPLEVLDHLGYENVETVYRLCKRGLPHVRVGRDLRFKLSRVDSWVEEQSPMGQGGEVIALDSRRAG